MSPPIRRFYNSSDRIRRGGSARPPPDMGGFDTPPPTPPPTPVVPAFQVLLDAAAQLNTPPLMNQPQTPPPLNLPPPALHPALNFAGNQNLLANAFANEVIQPGPNVVTPDGRQPRPRFPGLQGAVVTPDVPAARLFNQPNGRGIGPSRRIVPVSGENFFGIVQDGERAVAAARAEANLKERQRRTAELWLKKNKSISRWTGPRDGKMDGRGSTPSKRIVPVSGENFFGIVQDGERAVAAEQREANLQAQQKKTAEYWQKQNRNLAEWLAGGRKGNIKGRGSSSSRIRPERVAESRPLTEEEQQQQSRILQGEARQSPSPSRLRTGRRRDARPIQIATHLRDLPRDGAFYRQPQRGATGIRNTDYANWSDRDLFDIENMILGNEAIGDMFGYTYEEALEILNRADFIRNQRIEELRLANERVPWDFQNMSNYDVEAEHRAYLDRRRRGEYEPLSQSLINQLENQMDLIRLDRASQADFRAINYD